jgi:rhodanese-related sulfurtransferase
MARPVTEEPVAGETCPFCLISSGAAVLARLAAARFPHALRAAGLLCFAALAAGVWNARLPLGIPWLPSPGNRVGIPRVLEGRLPEVNAAQALKLYQAGDALFVDSRERKDYDQDHIPGAINLPQREWAKLWPTAKEKLPKDRLLVLYCYGMHCGLSTRQGKALLGQGYAKLVILDYGWKTWTGHGYPTVKQPPGRKG